MVMSILIVGSLAPEEVSAQRSEESREERSEESREEVAGADVPDTNLDEREASRFELSTGVGLQLGLGGLGPGLGNGLVALVPTYAELGVPLGSRALITVGIDVAVSSGSSFEYLSASLPLGVLVYFDAPRAGAVVPLLRAALIGTVSSLSTADASPSSYLGASALVRGGLTWFPLEALGLRTEIGIRGDFSEGPGFTTMALRGDAALSLVLRL